MRFSRTHSTRAPRVRALKLVHTQTERAQQHAQPDTLLPAPHCRRATRSALVARAHTPARAHEGIIDVATHTQTVCFCERRETADRETPEISSSAEPLQPPPFLSPDLGRLEARVSAPARPPPSLQPRGLRTQTVDCILCPGLSPLADGPTGHDSCLVLTNDLRRTDTKAARGHNTSRRHAGPAGWLAGHAGRRPPVRLGAKWWYVRMVEGSRRAMHTRRCQALCSRSTAPEACASAPPLTLPCESRCDHHSLRTAGVHRRVCGYDFRAVVRHCARPST